MRADFTGDQNALWKSPEKRWIFRVLIDDGSGFLRNWTSLFGFDLIESFDWGDTLEQPGQDANFKLAYRRYFDNASPYVTETRMSNLLNLVRRIVIQGKLITEGMSSGGLYSTFFDGKIDSLDLTDEHYATLTARDRVVAHLQDTWIQAEQVYGSETGVDMDVTLRDIINDHADPAIVNFTAGTPPDFAINKYKQQPMPIMQALTAISLLIGWDLRSKFLTTKGVYGLVLDDVDREDTNIAYTFAPDTWRGMARAGIKLDDIRNRIRVNYVVGLDSLGEFELDSVVVTDVQSRLDYGDRWMEITEGSTSAIKTALDAVVLANAILSDMKDPLVNADFDVFLFPWIEVNDLITLGGEGYRFGADQDVAVYGFRHTVNGQSQTTTMNVQGKPSSGKKNWRDREARPGKARPLPDLKAFAPEKAESKGSVAGTTISWSAPRGSSWDVVAVYKHSTPSFEPSLATLVGYARGTQFVDLNSSKEEDSYYKIVARDDFGNLSSPSPPLKAIAPFITPSDLQPAMVQGIRVTNSVEQLCEPNDYIDFDTVVFGGGLSFGSPDYFIQPTADQVARISFKITKESSTLATTWSLTIRDATDDSAIASTQTVPVAQDELEFDDYIAVNVAQKIRVSVNFNGGTEAELSIAKDSTLTFMPTPVGIAPPTGVAPTNTVRPTITGTPQEGSTLTCLNGTWTGSPTPTYAYQWYRGSTLITGATSSTFVLSVADEGALMSCMVTATVNGVGSAHATTLFVGPVIRTSTPINTELPEITGTNQVGSVLTCSEGLWDYTTGSFLFLWLRDGVPITGGVGTGTPTYTLTDEDEDTLIGCRVYTFSPGGGESVAYAEVVGPITISAGGGVAPVITGSPSIDAILESGIEATITPASVTGTPTPDVTYQLQSSDDDGITWADLGAAFSSLTFTPEYAQVIPDEVSIRVKQIATNTEGSDDAASAGSEVILNVSDLSPVRHYEPRISRCWQERDGSRTTLSGVGDPIGELEDLGSQNSSIKAVADNNRPTLLSGGIVDHDSDDYLNSPTGLSTLVGADAMTHVHVGFTSSGATAVLSAGNGASVVYSPGFLRIGGGTSLRWYAESTTSTTFSAATISGINTSIQVLLGELDAAGGTRKLYHDSFITPVDSDVIPTGLVDPGSDVYTIGARNDGAFFSQGEWTISMVFGDKLTATEKAQLRRYITYYHGV